MIDPRKVFVVHGRNLKMRDSLFRFLRSIGLQPIEWSQAIKLTGKASPYIGEILDVSFATAQAIIVLMTPDDEARLQSDFVSPHDPLHEINLTGQARPNVLFEAGMAMGRSPERTLIIEIGQLRPFSDIGGRHVIRLYNSPTARKDLAERLVTAGCDVDLSGTDWMNEGDFALTEIIITPKKSHSAEIIEKIVKIGACEITYPQITGLENRSAETRINSSIYDRLVHTVAESYRDPESYRWDKERLANAYYFDPINNEGVIDTVDYFVSFNFFNLLSIAYNFHAQGGAHPSISSSAITADLETGHIYSFAELFRPDIDYLEVIHGLICKDLDEDLKDFPRRGTYDYSLNENSLHIFNLYDCHALHAVSAEIPYINLRPLIASDGIISRILAGTTSNT